jgi:uncharacterized protein (UPF0261 family)
MGKNQKKNIVLVGTLDTKGTEAEFLRKIIENQNLNVITIDVGTGAKRPPWIPDFPAEKVAEAAGVTIQEIQLLGQLRKSQEWIQLMGQGASKIVRELHDIKKIDGIISFGGNAGTSLGSLAMKSLPFGVPKVICSTVASGNTRPYIGTQDICMIPSIADIAGLNRITKISLTQAAGALIGMINLGIPKNEIEKPLIGVTEIGRLADISPSICTILKEHGYEVILFHAVGTGGMALEKMIEQGNIEGVLDLSLNEVMDHLHGGFCDAGPSRLEAAAEKGIPTVIAPGYINRIVYSSKESIPKEFAGRDVWTHGISIFIIPVTKEELEELAYVLAKKINRYQGPLVVLLPLRGLSSPKEKFDNPEINAAFFHKLRSNLKSEIKVKELNMHILDQEFAEEATKTLLELLKR